MKYLLVIGFYFIAHHTNAQFAVVSDSDGFVNVREDARLGSKIIGKLKSGSLIYCWEKRENWINIEFTQNKKDLNGFIYKNRCLPIDQFQKIPVVSTQENSITLKKDSLEIILQSGPFDKRKHKIGYYKEYPDQIEKIDQEQYWGTDGGMPKSMYKNIIIKISTKTIAVPAAALKNLYEPGLLTTEVNFDKLTNSIYIQTMNSDGAGSYCVIWCIENGVYKDRLIVYGF